MDQKEKPRGRGSILIDAILPRLQTDLAFAAALKRADNPATESQAWEYLVRYGCDLENSRERIAFSTVVAAIARAKPGRDGNHDIAQALASCFDNGREADSARAKMRRLLACVTTEEACLIVRPLLSLINSRGVSVSYGRLLDDLLYFGERVKLSWAQSFYRGAREEG